MNPASIQIRLAVMNGAQMEEIRRIALA
jgi:hypothetical protein